MKKFQPKINRALKRARNRCLSQSDIYFLSTEDYKEKRKSESKEYKHSPAKV